MVRDGCRPSRRRWLAWAAGWMFCPAPARLLLAVASRDRVEDGMVSDLGTEFSDAQRDVAPPLGSTVTYTHRGRTPQGVPRS